MKNIICGLTFIISLLIISGCGSTTTGPDENPFDFPNRFEGMEADVVFVADSVITRVRRNNQITTYPYSNLQFALRNFILAPNGRFAYFLDQSLVVNSTGRIVRLDLNNGNFNFVSDRQFSSFGLLGNNLLTFTDPNVNCPDTPVSFRAFTFLNVLGGNVVPLCDAYLGFLTFTNLPSIHTYSVNQLRMDGNDLVARISWVNNELSERQNTLMDVRFEFSENRLIPVQADTVARTNRSGPTSPSGRYMVNFRNNGLWLVDFQNNSEVKMADTFSNPAVTFLDNETKVAFILTRDNVTAENQSRGLYTYNITTSTLREVFPAGQTINSFHFSPSSNQVVVSGVIPEIHPTNNQIFIMNANGSNPAMVSNVQKQNVTPRFIGN